MNCYARRHPGAGLQPRGHLRRRRKSDTVSAMSRMYLPVTSARTRSESLFALVFDGLLLRPART
jgi:hypothetical protein